MIKSFEVTPLTYENSTYGIRVQYPPDWTVSGTNESRAVSSFVMFANFFSPSSGVATISLGTETPTNLTTNLHNYEQYSINSYKHFAAFKLLELNTNSTLAGKPAYTIVGTYQDPSSGPQKLMEVGTITGGKVYFIQYIAGESKYSDYLSVVQGMIDSLAIKGSVG